MIHSLLMQPAQSAKSAFDADTEIEEAIDYNVFLAFFGLAASAVDNHQNDGMELDISSLSNSVSSVNQATEPGCIVCSDSEEPRYNLMTQLSEDRSTIKDASASNLPTSELITDLIISETATNNSTTNFSPHGDVNSNPPSLEARSDHLFNAVEEIASFIRPSIPASTKLEKTDSAYLIQHGSHPINVPAGNKLSAVSGQTNNVSQLIGKLHHHLGGEIINQPSDVASIQGDSYPDLITTAATTQQSIQPAQLFAELKDPSIATEPSRITSPGISLTSDIPDLISVTSHERAILSLPTGDDATFTLLPMVNQSDSPIASSISTNGDSIKLVQAAAIKNEIISVFKNLDNTQERIILQMDPPELGKIAIEFKFDGSRLQHVTMICDAPSITSQLKQNIQEFNAALIHSGQSGFDMSFAERRTSHKNNKNSPLELSDHDQVSPLNANEIISSSDYPLRNYLLTSRLDIKL